MAKAPQSPVFIDTSFFKAILDEKDDFYKEALGIWEKLRAENASLLTSNYILDEVFTLIRKRSGVAKVKEFRELVIQNAASLKIIRVTAADEANAWNWFLEAWRDLSFTDCVSFALMERVGLKRVATFDRHFSQAGFKVEK
ncbi:PIN domain-containing protein [Candidatus Shapirobacteria bacterium]|nr:PIN domain-containing protein [Chloroflexota bacterium]MBM3208892.1 PIN domain-containing protein [Candidatus Shapirobacteria bacterium]